MNTEVTEDAEENVKGWSMDSLNGMADEWKRYVLRLSKASAIAQSHGMDDSPNDHPSNPQIIIQSASELLVFPSESSVTSVFKAFAF